MWEELNRNVSNLFFTFNLKMYYISSQYLSISNNSQIKRGFIYLCVDIAKNEGKYFDEKKSSFGEFISSKFKNSKKFLSISPVGDYREFLIN